MNTNRVVDRAMDDAVNEAVDRAVDRAVYWTVDLDVYRVVDLTVDATGYRTVYDAVNVAVCQDPPHPSFAKFLTSDQEVS